MMKEKIILNARIRVIDPMPDMERLLAEGWQIQDHPQMKKSYWEYFLKGYGEKDKDYIVLSEADYDNGAWWRGQLLLGPNARQNLKKYRENNEIPE